MKTVIIQRSSELIECLFCKPGATPDQDINGVVVLSSTKENPAVKIKDYVDKYVAQVNAAKTEDVVAVTPLPEEIKDKLQKSLTDFIKANPDELKWLQEITKQLKEIL